MQQDVKYVYDVEGLQKRAEMQANANGIMIQTGFRGANQMPKLGVEIETTLSTAWKRQGFRASGMDEKPTGNACKVRTNLIVICHSDRKHTQSGQAGGQGPFQLDRKETMAALEDFPAIPKYFESALHERYLLYRQENGCSHPLWPWGDAIIVLTSVAQEDVDKKIKMYKTRSLPSTARTVEEIENIGFLQLKPGNAVFIRIVEGERDRGLDGNPEADDLQGWVTDEGVLQQSGILGGGGVMERMDALSQEMLGPVEQRSESPPSAANKYTGGIALERELHRLNSRPSNRQGARCYSLGYTVERPRGVVHPAKNMQQDVMEPGGESIRSRLLNVTTEYGGLAMRLAPQDRINLLEQYGLQRKVPPMGHRNNRLFWTGLQANVSRPVLSGNSDELKQDLGRAGDAHPDNHDQIGSFTQILVLSKTPAEYTPAYFFLIEFGLFTVMEYGTTIAFSGLRLHSRIPSIAPSSVQQIPSDIYSIVAVLYQTSMLANIQDCRVPLCTHPTAGTLTLPPEAWKASLQGRRQESTMFQDGHTLGGERHPEYMLTLLSGLINYATSFDPEYNIHFDPTEFANITNITRRRTGETIHIDASCVNAPETAATVTNWNALIRQQRLLLGGPNSIDGVLPSRAPMDESKPSEAAEVPKTSLNLRSSKETKGKDKRKLLLHVFIKDRISADGKLIMAVNDTEAQASSYTEGASSSRMTLRDRSRNSSRGRNTGEEYQSDADNDGEPEITGKQPGAIHIAGNAPILRLLNKTTLEEELRKVKGELSSNARSRSTYVLPNAGHVASLSATLIAFSHQDPRGVPGVQVATQMPNIWANLVKTEKRLQAISITDRILKHALIVGTWKAWVFLEVDCREDCQSALHKRQRNWLTDLSRKIYDHQTHRMLHTLELNSKVLLRGFDRELTAKIKPTTTIRLGSDAEDHTINLVLDTLGEWMGYPRKGGKASLWKQQGAMLDVLVSLTGNSHLFFLEETWVAFKNPKSAIFLRKPVRKIPESTWTLLEDKLREKLDKEGKAVVMDHIEELGRLFSPYIGQLEMMHQGARNKEA
ncbi:hypothetical protein NEOLEDRAFT_1149143 [Neolentinus lepideus HHB14362 ss-1]|uniref:Uncharacterized protein n=1 Tax=Neolentinus lepideus HHB14362 ss-1 TaxID=1314782 RepID=A0A165RCK3_9AGAM|nr:hypothetical protein NEOLEDRAFT_1149143 [Neolentinus lepideus HHB14362 ss-1]